MLSPAISAVEQVHELQARIRSMQSSRLEERRLPTLPVFSELLPGGALKSGAAYSVTGSTTLAMALLAGPSAAGSWCGVIGVPDFGAEAAAALGIDLERLVLVPDPGEQWLAVTAAIVDVLSVVVTRPSHRMSDAEAARLNARLRQREASMIVLGGWPQSEAALSVGESRWHGLGTGHGYLSGRQVTVTTTSRLVSSSRRVWLPDSTAEPLQRVRLVDEQPAASSGSGLSAVPALSGIPQLSGIPHAEARLHRAEAG